MNRNGIFSFLLLLAFFSIELVFLDHALEANNRLETAKAIAFEAEKSSFTRALMEESVDTLVEKSLRQGLILNQEPEELKKNVNSKLEVLFREMEVSYLEGARVRFGEKSLSQSFLNENSTVLVSRIDKKTVLAEYCFTGGLMREEEVVAEILGKAGKHLFKVPAGYTIEARLVG